MSIILVAPLYNKCCTFVLSVNTRCQGIERFYFSFIPPEGYCVNQFYFHQNVFAWAISTSPRRWTPCWRDQAMCAQQWQSLGPWQRNILKQRSKMCNKKKGRHTLASFPEDSNKITSRHKYTATLYEHKININKKSRPSNISVVVPASRKSCSVEGHWDCGGNEEKASQDGNGKLKRKEI